MSVEETPVAEAPEPDSPGSPLDAVTGNETVQAHPEILVGAAFAGAFVFAKVLRAAGNRE